MNGTLKACIGTSVHHLVLQLCMHETDAHGTLDIVTKQAVVFLNT